RLQQRGTPVVLVDSRPPARGRCSVAVDDVLGGELAVAHLIEAGHIRIAFVGGPLSIRQVADRREGAIRALERAGASADHLHMIVTPALNVAAGLRAGATLAELPSRQRPTAVFCANDLLALGVLQEMTAQRIRVPEDISLIGYDDIDFAAAAAVPLSSVRQPRQLLGRTAAQLPHRRAAAARRGARRGRAPAPAGPVRAGTWGPPRQPGPRARPGLAVRIALFVTCLADSLFPQVGRATVQLLERLGHEVTFSQAQTCCGQMHTNTGYLREALPLVRRYVEVFEDCETVVVPSGSC